MSFTQRIHDYLIAEAGDNKIAGQMLPIGKHAELRKSRLGGRDRAREYRLAIQDQCSEIRKTISQHRSWEILATEVEALLRLLDESDDR